MSPPRTSSRPAVVTDISVAAGESCDVTSITLDSTAAPGPDPRDAEPRRLADLTTLRVGGPARRIVTATTGAELVEAVTAADAAGEPVLVLGGGSNVLVADEGFPGTVVRLRSRG